MTNLYHILDKEPVLEREDMPIELEELAKKFVESGLLRIDAYNQINFARFFIPQIDFSTMISKRQLIDESLLPKTKRYIKTILRKKYRNKIVELDSEVNETIDSLKAEIQKYLPISYNMEMKLARILVQAIHPIVIELVLIENVQVFVSYSHNIGDVLDIPSWQHSGSNSGMQSTDGSNVAIYVSCGGDPLYIEKKKDKEENIGPVQDDPTYGSGKPALARTMIIAAQELGHYSDIIRDPYGRYIHRHSASFSGMRANNHVKVARLKDIKNVINIKSQLIEIGLLDLVENERHVKFFRKNKVNNFRSLSKKLYTHFKRKKFINKLEFLGFFVLKKFSKELYPATIILSMLEDMAFNLAPEADVYKHPDKRIEEAIACIEALARVPQQCNKWGDLLTEFIYPQLFRVYYKEVIPSCINDYQNLTGKRYKLNSTKYTYLSWYKKRKIKLKRVFYEFWKKKYLTK